MFETEIPFYHRLSSRQFVTIKNSSSVRIWSLQGRKHYIWSLF